MTKFSKFDLIQYYEEIDMHVEGNNVLKNKLFNLIVANDWLDYLIENTFDEFGLYEQYKKLKN